MRLSRKRLFNVILSAAKNLSFHVASAIQKDSSGYALRMTNIGVFIAVVKADYAVDGAVSW